MPVRYVDLGRQRFLVGYCDEEQRIFYRWKGVVLTWTQLAQVCRIGGSDLLNEKTYREILLDPPLDYVWVDEPGRAAPGYLDRTTQRFYYWNGVWFDPVKVKSPFLGVVPKEHEFYIMTGIDVPAHLQPVADELAKTTMPPSTLLSKFPRLDLETARQLPVVGWGWKIGYVDLHRKIYFRWKGVVNTHEVGSGGFSGTNLSSYALVEVDPPVDYLMGKDALADAGYGTKGGFLRWRRVRFDPAKLSPQRIGISRRPEAVYAGPLICDIDVPKHRREFAEELKRTVPGETREKKEGKSAG